MEKMLKKIVGILAAILGFFSAVFYVLFRQAKDERKITEKENEDLRKNLDALSEADKKVNEAEKENEELKEKGFTDNTVDGLDALNKLLCK
jgi:cell shape-determining protein MreC